ncbi:MAG: tetratricopeptide repeat protein [Chloracidobacterium sp.]|nr:tetratricopeptide repeat protein [Chloracidobacterium sp.]MBL0239529.1 tetratricopeptide repeat protein [Chloracidobacterium sp.]
MKFMISIMASVLVVSFTCDTPKYKGTGNDSIANQESTRADPMTPPSPSPEPLSEEICIDRLAEIRVTSIKKGSAAAIPEYQSLLGNGCDHDGVRMAYGLALAGSDRFHEAVEQYRLVTKRNPRHWAAHWTLAQTLIIELGDFEEGLKETKRSRELDDLGDVGHLYDYYLGRAFEGMDKAQEALTHFRRFEKLQSKINKNDEKLIDTRKRIAKLEVTLENSGIRDAALVTARN